MASIACVLTLCTFSFMKPVGVIIITFESVKRDLIQALQSVSELSIRLDIVTIPSDDDWGTAESLRFIRDKIKVHLEIKHILAL